MALAWALGGCVGSGDSGGLALGSLLPWGDGTEAAPADVEETGRQAARSIWGVVPEPPQRKADLRPELIRGSAVAVSGDALLTSCRVVAGRSRVGLVRHNKYRIARVATVGENRQVCRLTVAEGPPNAAAGYRTFADLRVGEPVVAIASRTGAEVALAPGWLAGKGSEADPFLETTSVLPPGAEGAVLVDARGNLIGVGSAGPLADSVLMAVPLPPAAAPALANRDLGAAETLLASLAASPREQSRQAPILFPLRDDDRGDGAARLVAARPQASVDEAEPPAAPTPGSSPAPGSGVSGGPAPGGPAPGGPSAPDPTDGPPRDDGAAGAGRDGPSGPSRGGPSGPGRAGSDDDQDEDDDDRDGGGRPGGSDGGGRPGGDFGGDVDGGVGDGRGPGTDVGGGRGRGRDLGRDLGRAVGEALGGREGRGRGAAGDEDAGSGRDRRGADDRGRGRGRGGGGDGGDDDGGDDDDGGNDDDGGDDDD
jgi:hypothetical protein